MSTELSGKFPPDSLLIAIGRVATSSVRLENALRYVVGKLSGDHDAGWIIFEGQSMDWLLLNGNAVLGEYVGDEDGRNRRLGSYGRSLRKLFKEAESLKNDRNVVIHGEWKQECLLRSGCKPHSPDSDHAEELFHVIRSRYRRGYEEEAWSIADIEKLASKIGSLARELRGTYKASEDARLSPHRKSRHT